MKPRPTLRTRRLLLRPFDPEDAAAVRRLAGDREIALNTLSIPHPYEEGMAEAWLASHQLRFEEGRGVAFAMVSEGELVGAIGLDIDRENESAELGYWVGRPYWGRGFATEAASAVVAYGFRDLDLHRVAARCFRRNPASGRVLEKAGLRHEGSLREPLKKWGEFEDVEVYGIVRRDFEGGGSSERNG